MLKEINFLNAFGAKEWQLTYFVYRLALVDVAAAVVVVVAAAAAAVVVVVVVVVAVSGGDDGVMRLRCRSCVGIRESLRGPQYAGKAPGGQG